MTENHPRSRIALLYSILFALSLTVLIRADGIAQSPDPVRKETLLDSIPQNLLNRLAAGEPQDVIVEFGSTGVEAEARAIRLQKGLVHDDRDITEYKAQRFRQIKNSALTMIPATEANMLMDYSHLPMALLRLRSGSALARLLDLPQVVAVYENRTIYPYAAENMRLINQPQAAAAGYTGAGTTVAVLDTGVNYTVADFGSCTSPGVPSGCKVIAAVIKGNDSNPLDSNGHGTNVAGILVGVAPDARIAAVHVFNTDGTSTDSLVI
jgi:subtilisin family serine protease